LLDMFTDATCTPEIMKKSSDEYFSLIQAFILPLDGTTQENKLRFIQNFKWTDTLQGNITSAQQDAVFELVSMAFNVAIWYSKFASRLAGKENITEDEAKDVHKSLKIAAGIFKTLKRVQRDTPDTEIIHFRCSLEIFKRSSDHTLNTLDPECSSKWKKYLQLKQHFYMAYAHCYHGQTLLAGDKCGEAIRSLQEAEKCTQMMNPSTNYQTFITIVQ
ncbi:hypothetical protein cypCar_00044683, partial [Cyprinus carpio]